MYLNRKNYLSITYTKKMEQDLEQLLYNENVLGFNTLVNKYIEILDQTVLFSQRDFMDKMHRLLPFIYLKALTLPDLEAMMPEMIEKTVTAEEWEAVEQTLAKKIGEYNHYSETFDPLSNADDAMTSLAEGFTDIFQDLKDYIVLFNIGNIEIMNDALWECKNNFKNYWGQRLVNLQRVLHYLLYNNQIKLKTSDALTMDDFDVEKRIKKEE